MALDGRLLARARERLAERREENEREQRRRQERAYGEIPRLREIDAGLRRLLGELVGLTLRHEGGAALERVEARSEALSREKAGLLRARGLPEDYLDDIFSCPDCRDRGYKLGGDGRPCRCLMELYRQERARELSALLKLGADDFAKFDLGYYSDEVDARYGMSPRQAMEQVLLVCRKYAEGFAPGAGSLLLRGGTGLGKTFLSACIARRVAERGFSVVYDSAVAAFEPFEVCKFHRDGPGGDAAAEKCERILSCELMILDDLGTEMNTQFAQSALYTIVNTRLFEQRATIISTNLSAEEFRARYSAQTVSRVEGEYDTLLFLGRDVRAMKKEQRYS